MQVAFTWSHNIDTASEVSDFFGTSGYVPQDSRNLAGSVGNSEFDQRKALIITYVYAVPKVSGGKFVTALTRNWQLSGTTTFQDGLSSPVLTFGGESGTQSFHERPNCVGPIHYQLADLTQPYVFPGAFDHQRLEPSETARAIRLLRQASMRGTLMYNVPSGSLTVLRLSSVPAFSMRSITQTLPSRLQI